MFHGMIWREGDPVLLQDASIWAVRGFEAFVIAAFLLTLLWILRRRDPVLTGAFAACTLPMIYWDWIQNQPSQFRLVYDDRFIHAFRITDGPGFGPGEPWFLGMTYAIHFVPMAWWIVDNNEKLSARLGAWKWPALFLFIMPQNFIEIITVRVLKIYKYYLEPEWLTPWGFPWFNFIATPLIICMFAAMALEAKRIHALAAANGAGGLAPGEQTRIGWMLGAAATTTAFFLAWCLYHNLYLWAQPWLGGSPWPH
jgi:hypothetical protein